MGDQLGGKIDGQGRAHGCVRVWAGPALSPGGPEGLATRFAGHWIEYYGELPSTNQRARELAAANPPEGLVILAEKQTAGRGRLGRSWFSPAGTGIWMTILLKPPVFPMGELPKMTLLAAAAVAKAIAAQVKLAPLIKWPNDLYLENRKIAGVLTETAGKAGALGIRALGIGSMLIKFLPIFRRSREGRLPDEPGRAGG